MADVDRCYGRKDGNKAYAIAIPIERFVFWPQERGRRNSNFIQIRTHPPQQNHRVPIP